MGVFDNYDNVEPKRKGEYNSLPAGAYVARIKRAEEVGNDKYTALKIDFDIEQGEYKGYFEELYKNQNKDSRSWRGSFYAFYPKDNEYYASSAGELKHNIEAIEKSNAGFKMNHTSDGFTGESIAQLSGKLVGVIFFEKEYLNKYGKVKTGINVWGFETVEDVLSGNYEISPKQELKQEIQKSDMNGFNEFDNDDCPF